MSDRILTATKVYICCPYPTLHTPYLSSCSQPLVPFITNLCTALNFVELFHVRNMHDVLSLDFKQPTINRLKGCILHLCHWFSVCFLHLFKRFIAFYSTCVYQFSVCIVYLNPDLKVCVTESRALYTIVVLCAVPIFVFVWKHSYRF
jgi:hypothetical protein